MAPDSTIHLPRSTRRLVYLAALALALPAAAQSTEPAEVGQWSEVMRWSISATHAQLLPTGKVLYFGEFDEGYLPPRLWDPETGELETVTWPGFNIFCTGHSFLANGHLLLTGGHEESHVGLPHAALFNPFDRSWHHLPDMNDRRWYPTNTTLADGGVLVIAGEIGGSGDDNLMPQVLEPSEMEEPGSMDSYAWRDLTSALRKVPYYPRNFAAPDGRVFYAGPGARSLWLDTRGTGAWATGPRSSTGRNYGSAVMYDSRVLILGGGRPAVETAEEIDLAEGKPTWRPVASMHFARRQLNAVLLPDGSVLAVGGSQGRKFDDRSQPVLKPELWNRDRNEWTVMAPHAEFRGYHSTALLLPDGRVLSAGGRKRRTAEVFSPPYLFKGPRPTISSAPSTLQPGQSFHVETAEADKVQKVTLIAPAAVTHAFDQSQRLVTLSFSVVEGGLQVEAPPSNLAAPPGYYMLFLVNTQGVPSVAHWVQLEQGPLPEGSALGAGTPKGSAVPPEPEEDVGPLLDEEEEGP